MCVAMSEEDRCTKRFIEVTRSKKTDAIIETKAFKKPFNIRKVSYHKGPQSIQPMQQQPLQFPPLQDWSLQALMMTMMMMATTKAALK
jgi:hypothetical protein